MERINIKEINFQDICQLAKTEYPWVDKDFLIKQCESLKNKRVLDNTVRIENPRGRFLYLTIEEARYSADYIKATKEFLQSDYVSSIIKMYIYNILKYFHIDGDHMEVLKSDKSLNDFTMEQLRTIKMELDKLFMTTRFKDEIYNNIYDMFDDYMFVLDGEGPKEYLMKTYGNGLAMEMLKHSGLNNVPSKYNGNRVQRYFLSERHLMSLYMKFEKYMPEHKAEFIKLVKAIDNLSAANFISYYKKFVSHNFTTAFIAEEPVMPSEEEVPYETLEGKLSKEELEMDKKREAMAHAIIQKNFLKEVISYEVEKEDTPKKGK